MPGMALLSTAAVFAAALAAAAELAVDPARAPPAQFRDETALLQTGSSRPEKPLARPEASSMPEHHNMTFAEWRFGPGPGAEVDEEEAAWRSSNATYKTRGEKDIHIVIPDDVAVRCFPWAIFPASESHPMMPDDVCPSGSASYNNMVQAIAGTADLVYYLCIDCASVKIPAAFRGKVMLVDGLRSDYCLGPAVLGGLAHLRRVTAAHKLIVAHAQLTGRGRVAIFEEDFTLRETGCTQAEPELRSLVSDVERVKPTFLRLTFSCFIFDDDNHPPCRRCQCKSLGDRLCLVRPGCRFIWSSAAYMLSSSRYDALLQARGIIDSWVQRVIPSTIVLPVLGFQKSRASNISDTERNYKQNCLVDKWT